MTNIKMCPLRDKKCLVENCSAFDTENNQCSYYINQDEILKEILKTLKQISFQLDLINRDM